jgi:hypothetical protein
LRPGPKPGAHDIHRSAGQDKQAESEEATKQRRERGSRPNSCERREVGLRTPGPNPRYSCVRMPTKPTPFLHPNPLHEPELLATSHSRVIFCVGGDRFAIDFTGTVTELKPQPADVIPIKRNARRKGDHLAQIGKIGLLL